MSDATMNPLDALADFLEEQGRPDLSGMARRESGGFVHLEEPADYRLDRRQTEYPEPLAEPTIDMRWADGSHMRAILEDIEELPGEPYRVLYRFRAGGRQFGFEEVQNFDREGRYIGRARGDDR